MASSGPPRKHFAKFTDEEIAKKQEELENANSLANERKAVKCFQDYLKDEGVQDLNFFKYTESELDYYLGRFYFNTRTSDGDFYTSGTLNTLRYGLNRALKRFGHNFDITKRECISFTKSIKAFEDACKEIKKAGKGHIKHTKEITPRHLYEIYHSNDMDPDNNVRSLQNKVMWDIRYYFARRGKENIHLFQKDTFAEIRDPETNVSYIAKVKDEETKNHKEVNGPITTGFMPEIPYNKRCPVQSFLMYLYSLSPESNELWQQPKFTNFPADSRKRIWYGPGTVGHNKHDTFVSTMAKKAGLADEQYHNHCLRVTAINTLGHTNHTNKQIMSVSGHKSSKSLEYYQRVTVKEKLSMGFDLGASILQHPQPQNALPALNPAQPLQVLGQNMQQPTPQPTLAIQENVPQMHVAIPENYEAPTPDPVQSLQISESDIVNIIQECEKENENLLLSQQQQVTTASGSTMTFKQLLSKRSSPQVPIFHNCKIEGNITININK